MNMNTRPDPNELFGSSIQQLAYQGLLILNPNKPNRRITNHSTHQSSTQTNSCKPTEGTKVNNIKILHGSSTTAVMFM
ncbi:hypothetical protein Hanom_Chr04g00358101 [Helianthus anomalus]